MAETLNISGSTKAEIYESLLPQLSSLLSDESDQIANMANMAAALKQAFDFLWVGFYRVEGNQLVLGPFQGPIACTRIEKGRGVCGASWQKNQTLIVPDVNLFPGHIACSSLSRSEIVIPVTNKSGDVIAVLDIDSENLNSFDLTDKKYLEDLAGLLNQQAIEAVTN